MDEGVLTHALTTANVLSLISGTMDDDPFRVLNCARHAHLRVVRVTRQSANLTGNAKKREQLGGLYKETRVLLGMGRDISNSADSKKKLWNRFKEASKVRRWNDKARDRNVDPNAV
jgi:hypothetical protein